MWPPIDLSLLCHASGGPVRQIAQVVGGLCCWRANEGRLFLEQEQSPYAAILVPVQPHMIFHN